MDKMTNTPQPVSTKFSRLIPVVDLFAGPGGLGEGFSLATDRYGQRPFDIRVSIEKDAIALAPCV